MSIWQKVKMLIRGRKVLKEVIDAHDNAKEAYEKSSWKSSEFWMAVVAGLGGVAAQLTGMIPEPYGAIAASLSAALYALSRGMAKNQDPLGGLKPGVSTTEFWGNLVSQIGSVSLAVSGAVDPKAAAMLMLISNGAYGLSRGLAKGGKQPTV